jgi:DNA-binding NarL/FixJ family response regulator
MNHFIDNSENTNNKSTPIENKNKNIRVLVADDHKPMLDTIVKLLTPHFDIVGTAADGKAALEMIELLKPDIAVLDISMPFKTGIEIAADLKTSGQEVKVVIITAHGDEFYMRAAISIGASAFIVKSRLGDDLLPALEDAHAGKVFTSLDERVTGDLNESES